MQKSLSQTSILGKRQFQAKVIKKFHKTQTFADTLEALIVEYACMNYNNKITLLQILTPKPTHSTLRMKLREIVVKQEF